MKFIINFLDGLIGGIGLYILSVVLLLLYNAYKYDFFIAVILSVLACIVICTCWIIKSRLPKKQFESDEHVRNWLLRVAVNECNSMWNSSWRKKVILTDEQEDKPVFPTPEQSELYELVMQMSPKYRQVIYLYYFEGFSVREVASILKISETAVQTRLQRARNKLKEQLGGMI